MSDNNQQERHEWIGSVELFQFMMPKRNDFWGLTALFGVSIAAASICFGFYASVGGPPEHGVALIFYGGVGFLMNIPVIIISTSVLIFRWSTPAAIAFVVAMSSTAAFLLLGDLVFDTPKPPQEQRYKQKAATHNVTVLHGRRR